MTKKKRTVAIDLGSDRGRERREVRRKREEGRKRGLKVIHGDGRRR